MDNDSLEEFEKNIYDQFYLATQLYRGKSQSFAVRNHFITLRILLVFYRKMN